MPPRGYTSILAVLLAGLLPGLPSPAAGAEDLDLLRYDEAQFKAAHNSIDRAESLSRQLDWSEKEPHEGGCRGIELDIVQDPARTGPDDDWVFGVQHGGAYRADTPRLDASLREVRAWAKAHPRHDPITVHIDLKAEATLGDDAAFAKKIDEVLARELGRENIFTPADLQGGSPSLRAAVEERGFPTLGKLRGKFLVVFSGSDRDAPVARRRRAYLETSPRERLAFVDLDQRAAGADGSDECDIRAPYYNRGNRVFLNVELGRKDWTRLAREANARRFVTRVWKANDEESWKRARDARVNIVSTDRITGFPWASAGPRAFAPIRRRERSRAGTGTPRSGSRRRAGARMPGRSRAGGRARGRR